MSNRNEQVPDKKAVPNGQGVCGTLLNASISRIAVLGLPTLWKASSLCCVAVSSLQVLAGLDYTKLRGIAAFARNRFSTGERQQAPAQQDLKAQPELGLNLGTLPVARALSHSILTKPPIMQPFGRSSRPNPLWLL
jgi:hypothetical protein